MREPLDLRVRALSFLLAQNPANGAQTILRHKSRHAFGGVFVLRQRLSRLQLGSHSNFGQLKSQLEGGFAFVVGGQHAQSSLLDKTNKGEVEWASEQMRQRV